MTCKKESSTSLHAEAWARKEINHAEAQAIKEIEQVQVQSVDNYHMGTITSFCGSTCLDSPLRPRHTMPCSILISSA